MKIGIISDIHGNIDALNAVFCEFEKRKVEKIICCGDMIGIGLNSKSVLEKIMEKKDMIYAVRGNHERYFLNGIPTVVHDENRPIREEEIKHHKWSHGQVSKKKAKYLEELPVELYLEVQGKKIYVTHYPLDENGKYKRHIKKANADEVVELFKPKEADIYLYGHTHLENINKIDNKLYINPGSLGCPGTSNKAKCGILSIEDGEASYEEMNIEYDVNEVIEKIKQEKYPLYKKMLLVFYGVNEDIKQMLGETVSVENLEKIEELKNVYSGNVYFNNEKIKAYVIGDLNNSCLDGKVVGIIKKKDTEEKMLVISSLDANLTYSEIKGYFKGYIKKAKYRCLNEKAAGAVIYKMEDGEPEFLIIYSKKNIAGFPKGHIEFGETEKEAAKREIFEEVGLNVGFKNNFRETLNYYVDDSPIYKEIVFFLAEIDSNEIIKIDENELNDFKFLKYEQAKKALRKNVRYVLERAKEKIDKENY